MNFWVFLFGLGNSQKTNWKSCFSLCYGTWRWRRNVCRCLWLHYTRPEWWAYERKFFLNLFSKKIRCSTPRHCSKSDRLDFLTNFQASNNYWIQKCVTSVPLRKPSNFSAPKILCRYQRREKPFSYGMREKASSGSISPLFLITRQV